MLRKQNNWLALILVAVLLLIASAYATIFFANRLRDEQSSSVSQSNLDITTIDVLLNDTYYETEDSNIINPPIWRVPAGADVLINFQNDGTLTHNWAIVQKGIQVAVPFEEGQGSKIIYYGAGMVYAHNRATQTFVAPQEPGEYQVICTVVGHYPTMQGKLIVE